MRHLVLLLILACWLTGCATIRAQQAEQARWQAMADQSQDSRGVDLRAPGGFYDYFNPPPPNDQVYQFPVEGHQ
jgi:hypothetical protein